MQPAVGLQSFAVFYEAAPIYRGIPVTELPKMSELVSIAGLWYPYGVVDERNPAGSFVREQPTTPSQTHKLGKTAERAVHSAVVTM